MKITRRQLRTTIREALDWYAEDEAKRLKMAREKTSAVMAGEDDEGSYEDLITALQGTFLGSPPREMDTAALTKVEEFYPDEAKELRAMSPNKLDNIIAMAWPTGY